ncbi:SDR family NAD(P)-dependent oxidoreductase [Rugosimonospora acidiphila]|uniref:SDR family NAD(P)-dependent oxidoreductase n=1 Tax=Rugosimonospora acidiphila TaxID=556531 RepID=A0ABP9SQ94_9ACTN
MLSTEHTDQVALITGATHGIGFRIAQALTASGATVIVHARTSEEGARAVTALLDEGADPLALHTVVADFSRLDEVRALAGRVAAEHGRLDLLVNNAATVGGVRRHITADGHELTFQVNYLAHYLLTRLLWEPLSGASHGRVVNLSSATHRGAHLSWSDMDRTTRYAPVAAYAQSKLALTMLSQALAVRRGDDTGTVSAVSVHPGVVATGTMCSVYGRYGAPVDRGAEAVLRLCDARNGVRNGGYYEGQVPAIPAALVHDQGSVDRLWRLSARLTGMALDADGLVAS